jgi:hypothetical protein
MKTYFYVAYIFTYNTVEFYALWTYGELVIR